MLFRTRLIQLQREGCWEVVKSSNCFIGSTNIKGVSQEALIYIKILTSPCEVQKKKTQPQTRRLHNFYRYYIVSFLTR